MHRKNWPVHSSDFLLSCSTQGELWVNLLELGWLEELEDHETFSLFIRLEATLILKQRSGSCSVSIHWHFSWQPILNKNRHPYLSERLCSDYFFPHYVCPLPLTLLIFSYSISLSLFLCHSTLCFKWLFIWLSQWDVGITEKPQNTEVLTP